MVPTDRLITVDRVTVTAAAEARLDQRCSMTAPASTQKCLTVAGFGQAVPERCDIGGTAAYDPTRSFPSPPSPQKTSRRFCD